MNLPIFQAPSRSAFSSSRTRLSIFSSGSMQRPQLATGVQVLGLPGCRCKSKAAMPRLETLVSIRSSSDRSAFSQRGTLMTSSEYVIGTLINTYQNSQLKMSYMSRHLDDNCKSLILGT